VQGASGSSWQLGFYVVSLWSWQRPVVSGWTAHLLCLFCNMAFHQAQKSEKIDLKDNVWDDRTAQHSTPACPRL
jgi:hypothetical protein